MKVVWIVLLIACLVYVVLNFKKKPQVVVIHPQKFKARRNELLVFLERCKRAFVVNETWSSVVDMADVYRKGRFPTYRPNKSLALELYALASHCPNPSVAGAAQLKFIECRGETIASEDTAGLEIPHGYAFTVIQHVKTLQSPRVETPRVERPVPPVMPVAQPHTISSDAQNVHDHGVIRSMHAILQGIPETQDDSYERIVDYVLTSDASATVKSDALAVLDTLSNQTHSTLETSEREALNKVWTTIESFEDSKKSDARQVLVGQLASGVEDGAVVCSTGKIARIVGTLDGLTPEVPDMKPTWALREEIGTLAAKIRDADGDSQKFKTEAKKVYVDDLGMDPEIIDAIVDEYSIGFEV
jgi:hypothetical protein